ncbi:BAS1 Myb-like DNA-binding protein BAS1 [Candida maltosa Xu316]
MSSSERETSDASTTTKKRVVQIDPLAITESLGFQTFRKGGRKPWTKEEDAKLLSLVESKYPAPVDPDQVNWEAIAQIVSPDELRKGKDCRKRWSNSLDPSLRKGKWTPEEDELLVKAYEKHGASWLKVSQEIEGRTDDQCAKRYMEVLDPKTKNRLKPWSMEEDLKLIQQIKIHGTKWRTVCSSFESRPSLTCRNRWRKLVTDVVRGKADPLIKQEVEKVTQHTDESNENKETNILEVLSKQQEELTRNNRSNDIKRPRSVSKKSKNDIRDSASSISRSISVADSTTSNGSTREVEWRYTLTPNNESNKDTSFVDGNLFENGNGGLIANQKLVQYLVSYAKRNQLNVTVHQHIHHHYGANRGESNDRSNNSAPNGYYVEPEDQSSRAQHFNYLPSLVQVPKLNSSQSSPSNSSHGESSKLSPAATQHHYHHHHHHHHHGEKGSDFDSNRESDLMKLLNNTEDFNRQREITPSSNPLTPLTQAVEYVEAEDNQKAKRRKLDKEVQKRLQHDIPSEDEEELDFWETMRNLTDLSVVNSNPNVNTAAAANTSVNAQTQTQTQTPYSQKPVSQHHPLHYHNSNTRENTPKPVVKHSNNNSDDEEDDEDDEEDEEDEEGLDEEDKVLAREVGEVGVDQETLNSYGLFYNVYTREGSTFPDLQSPQHNQQQQKYSVYDQWGGGFGMIPFNPS